MACHFVSNSYKYHHKENWLPLRTSTVGSLIGFDFRFARRFSIPFGRRPLVLKFVINNLLQTIWSWGTLVIILKFLFVGWVELKTLTLTNNMILCSIICLFLCLFFPCLGIFYQASAFSQMTKIFILFILFIKRSDFFIILFFHHSQLRIIHYMRNCYYRTPNVNVCTNAWQQEEKNR